MHLFILTWNCNPTISDGAILSLAKMKSLYHHLDLNSLWQYKYKDLVVSSIHIAPELSGKRQYRHISEANITLFDGCSVDTEHAFSAHRAGEAESHWDEISQDVEGQFVYIKAAKNAESLEIITDPIGVYQVYITKVGEGHIISNSAYLIEAISDRRNIDLLGASLYLSMGWAGSDRTLLNGIHVLPGGSITSFHHDQPIPKFKKYFSRQNILPGSNKLDIDQTTKQLSNIVKLTSDIDLLECPITAGRDSRALVAMIHNQKIPARYFSSGETNTADVEIGSLIAHKFNLKYRHLNQAENFTEQQWDEAIHRILFQTDGMGTLAHIGNGLNHPTDIEQFKIHYYGAGGEIARSYWFKGREDLYLFPASINRCRNALKQRLNNNRAILLNPETLESFNNYIDNYAASVLDDGFKPMDIERLFYTEERVRRWAGNNFRQVNDYMDVFSPYCTRPFVIASFMISQLERYAEAIHYRLIAKLDPELCQLPMETPWNVQDLNALYSIIALKYAKKKTKSIRNKIFNLSFFKRKQPKMSHSIQEIASKRSSQDIASKRSDWLEDRIEVFRSFCLDQNNSEIWGYFNKAKFEDLMRKDQVVQRKKHQGVLYDAITLFCYEKYRFDIENKIRLLEQ